MDCCHEKNGKRMTLATRTLSLLPSDFRLNLPSRLPKTQLHHSANTRKKMDFCVIGFCKKGKVVLQAVVKISRLILKKLFRSAKSTVDDLM